MQKFDALTAIHFQETDPGLEWMKDSEIALDLDSSLDSLKILTPNVVKLPEGGYRMYYTGYGPARSVESSTGYILSAYSVDANRWGKERGVRVEVHEPYASQRTLCPDVIPLPDGRWRMYFEARVAGQASHVLSAVSEGGLEWRMETGIRFGDGEWSYGSPRCLYIEESGRIRFRLYCHHYSEPMVSGLEAQNHIVSAVSDDGLHFEPEPGVRIRQENVYEAYAVYAPEVLRLGDGSYRMYYPGWSEDPMHGRIFSAVSRDGIEWVKDDGIRVDIGGPRDQNHCSEPCVIDLPDGRRRMFYEACDKDSDWRILSATTP
ncbi:MAG: hypothetical protein O3B01_32325 [Planctomycetota bacterium]|nr:hypothetical protein [Planctomycetota bacterium]MDA1143269.1 hypothetical protein [Planctomycetota bacterium]